MVMPFTIFNKVALLFKRVDKIEPQVDEIQEDIGQYIDDYLDTYINEDYLVQTGVIPNNDDTSKCATTEWTNDTIDTVNDTCLHKTGNESASGVKTFTDSPIVPTTPAETTSVVNQAYVESTVDGVNNLLHKSGNEIAVGVKNGDWRGIRLNKPQGVTTGKWLRYCSFSTGYYSRLLEIICEEGNNGTLYGLALVGGGAEYGRNTSIINVLGIGSSSKIAVIHNNTTYNTELWIYISSPSYCNNIQFYFKNGFNPNVTYYNTEHDTIEAPEGEVYGAPTYLIGSA